MSQTIAAYVSAMTYSYDKDPTQRCRLIITMGDDAVGNCTDSQFSQICAAGDIASIIFHRKTLDEAEFQKKVARLVTIAQENGIAAIVDHDSRIAGRVNADGLQLGQDMDSLKAAIEKFSPKLMIGAGNVKTRHNALTIGELQPDYLMFGKPGGDIREEPHPKNIDLGKWWSTMVEIPCIVLGGTHLESVIDVAQCGAEFVALGNAIFPPDKEGNIADHAVSSIEKANELLDEHAPIFETPDA